MLRDGLQDVVLAGAVFGSVARREETPDSDLDICLIVPSSRDKERARARAHQLAPSVWKKFGAQLSPVILTKEEFRRRHAKKDPLVEDLFAEAEWFVGDHARGLVDGKKK
jgi:predicted nucleotidyltransferase